MTNYRKYRGKCKELSETLVKYDHTLRLVRGYYYCPIWNVTEQHWWCETELGTIIDPSAAQYPSNGMGKYEEFDGIIECSECHTKFAETDSEAKFEGRYGFCSTSCLLRFVGL